MTDQHLAVGTHAIKTVRVVQIRTADLRERMVARRQGTTDPWRFVDSVIAGDTGHGIEDVIIAGGGDPKAEGDSDVQKYARWPFERAEHHAFPRTPTDQRIRDSQFHWDDVAIIFLVPHRGGDAEEHDHELVISDRHDLWDVQVLTQSPLALQDGELFDVSEGAATDHAAVDTAIA